MKESGGASKEKIWCCWKRRKGNEWCGRDREEVSGVGEIGRK